jgi:endonuclease/exonuclease/phosphatase (EEP) superfamily protein YafD
VAASILARGKVSPAKLPLPSRADFVQARVRLVSGIEADVISLRLLPGIVRMDMWAWSCWQAHRQHRQAQREQLRPIVQQMDSLPRNVPLIVGGDFNAPAGDAIFRLLHPRLRDAFKEGGVGWGNTFMNDLPIIRIDQIWVNDNFRVAAVVARRTKRSDHRMVICDLILKRGFD